MVVGDTEHLERLVLNLVSNAVKFTERGGVGHDRARADPATSPCCRVADTGMGIPFEEQANLFQRFFRSSVATERAIQGTGLGLNIVAVDRRGAPGQRRLRVDVPAWVRRSGSRSR